MANVQSNLVGERVQITIGLDYNNLPPKNMDSPTPAWRLIGDFGWVRAVTTTNGEVVCVVQMEDGSMYNLYATHLRIVSG